MASAAKKKSLKRARRRENQKKKQLAHDYQGILIRGAPESHLVCFDDNVSTKSEHWAGNDIPAPIIEVKYPFSLEKSKNFVRHPIVYPFCYVLSCVWDEMVLFSQVLKNGVYHFWDWVSKGSEKRGMEYDTISEPIQFSEKDKKMMRAITKCCRLFFGLATPLFVLLLMNVKLWIWVESSFIAATLTITAVILFVMAAYKLLMLNEFYQIRLISPP